MKCFMLCIPLFVSGELAGQTHGQPVTFNYCTNVGPVELTIDGETAKGKYAITITAAQIDGILEGSFQSGLMDGFWDDPDGRGRMIMAFTGDMTEFTALYNAPKRDPKHWYSAWKAVRIDAYQRMNADQQKQYICNPKK